MNRSTRWREITTLVQRSHRQCDAFDPETDDPERCLRDGVEPIVSLYVEVHCDADDELCEVEQSLLERALNDWLSLYAACHGAALQSHVTVHEMAVASVGEGDVRTLADELLGV